MPFERELEVAIRLARAAGEAALVHQRRGVAAETKPDLSPVTVADRDSERVIAGGLAEAFPADGLLGEEGAAKTSASGRRWIIDPIDGTRDFLRGIPVWSVLIGLEEGSDVVAGVCHLPALGRTYYAARGAGAFQDGSPIRISSIAEPAKAVLSVNALNDLPNLPFAPGLLAWMERFWSFRNFGGCLDAMMVASGHIDAWIEPTAKAWDLAPLQVIAEEAGATFFNFDGGRSIHAGNCVLCVPALEEELRRFVMGTR